VRPPAPAHLRVVRPGGLLLGGEVSYDHLCPPRCCALVLGIILCHAEEPTLARLSSTELWRALTRGVPGAGRRIRSE
jgi:hypothetical protein